MGFQSFQLNLTSELFDRSIKASPKDAVKELIWNSCDADAKNIDISFEIDTFGGVEHVSAIIVKDDGTGIPFDRIKDIFGRYGSSDKTYSYKIPGGRLYHGKLGQAVQFKQLTGCPDKAGLLSGCLRICCPDVPEYAVCASDSRQQDVLGLVDCVVIGDKLFNPVSRVFVSIELTFLCA